MQSFVTRAAHTPAPSLDNGALQRQRTATDDGHAEAGSSAAVSDGAPSPAAASASQQTSSLIGDLLDLDISEPTPAAAPPPPPVEGSILPIVTFCSTSLVAGASRGSVARIGC